MSKKSCTYLKLTHNKKTLILGENVYHLLKKVEKALIVIIVLFRVILLLLVLVRVVMTTTTLITEKKKFIMRLKMKKSKTVKEV
jgi:hypothetical protein